MDIPEDEELIKRYENKSSNRSWAYTGEIFISPSASKIYPRRMSTTTCKGTAHSLTNKTNIYTKT